MFKDDLLPGGDEDEVVFGYSSNHNISFHGDWETGYTVAEWKELTDEEKDNAFTEAVFDLVDIYVKNEGVE
jgi:hypothetical protein